MKKDKRLIDNINIHEAAVYFNGENSMHNHPMLYADGIGFHVATRLGVNHFAHTQLDKALTFYRIMIEEMDYAVLGDPYEEAD